MEGGENTVGTGAYTFLGSYAHTVDDKGRIIIPNPYRIPLGATFTIGPTRDFQGIGLYPNEVFNKNLSDILAMNQRKQVVQKYLSQFAKLSYPDMQADTQGRLLLPSKIRQRLLGEAKDLEISGYIDHVRIVGNVKANDEDTSFMDNLDTILEQIGDMDIRHTV